MNNYSKTFNDDFRLVLTNLRPIQDLGTHEKRINNQGTLTTRQLRAILELGGWENKEVLYTGTASVSKIFNFKKQGKPIYQVMRVTITVGTDTVNPSYCYVDIILGLNVDLGWLRGKYLGYPSCCIASYKKMHAVVKDDPSIKVDHVFQGTGYHPCAECSDTLSKEEMVTRINEGAINKDIVFPEDHGNLVYVNLIVGALKAVLEGKIDLLSSKNPDREVELKAA